MFAELEVLTDRTAAAILTIKNCVVEEWQKLVYVQNGNAYQSVEVTLAQMSGDMVEVKSGLFGGDLIVPACASTLCSIFGMVAHP